MLKTRLREIRERQQLTQHELAKRCGLNSHTISEIECGHRKTIWIDTLNKLAHGLGVKVDELVKR